MCKKYQEQVRMQKANVFRYQCRAQQSSDEESTNIGSSPGSSDGAISCRLHKIVSSVFVVNAISFFPHDTCNTYAWCGTCYGPVSFLCYCGQGSSLLWTPALRPLCRSNAPAQGERRGIGRCVQCMCELYRVEEGLSRREQLVRYF